jgi:hypothetical protein
VIVGRSLVVVVFLVVIVFVDVVVTFGEFVVFWLHYQVVEHDELVVWDS